MSEKLNEQLVEAMQAELQDHLDVFHRLLVFAEWLHEGIQATNDPMLDKVMENYLELFKNYIGAKEGASDDGETN